jgi:cobalt/nickel transport protein
LKLEYIVLGIILIFGVIFAYNVIYANQEWAGADVSAGGLIEQIAPNYRPWFNPVFEPPSGEVETFFFALQAAIGSIIIGYFLGYYRGLAKAKVAVPPKGEEGATNPNV